jgi:hypothetical protein
MPHNVTVPGDPNSVLRNGPSKLVDPTKWTQTDSDILAHFIQVDGQIRKSAWFASSPSFTRQGEKLLDVEMPEFEQFVYAAVYFRQFTLTQDRLMKDAADRYCSHTSCVMRQHFIQFELSQFTHTLDSKSWPFAMEEFTLRQLFDAFLYGAGLIHKFRPPGHPDRKNFLLIHDKHPRAEVLFALNSGLQMLMKHVAHASVVMRQDLGYWLHTHSLPRPDVRWHDRIFNVPLSK